MLRTMLVTGSLLVASVAMAADRSAAPEEANLYFITPSHGERVESPVTVRFGAQGIGVAPSGVDAGGTGHHHLIVDGELPAMDQPIPSNETYRHFGGGQTQTTLQLEPGKHTLQLLLGDHRHVPHDPPVQSEPITIHVVD